MNRRQLFQAVAASVLGAPIAADAIAKEQWHPAGSDGSFLDYNFEVDPTAFVKVGFIYDPFADVESRLKFFADGKELEVIERLFWESEMPKPMGMPFWIENQTTGQS